MSQKTQASPPTPLFMGIPTTLTVGSTGNSGDVDVSSIDTLAIDVTVVDFPAGSSPTITFFWERKGADGVYYPIWSPATVSAAGVVSTSIGRGMTTAQAIGQTGRLRWVVGGTASPTSHFSASIVGQRLGNSQIYGAV